MNIIRQGSIFAIILAGTLGLSACGKPAAPPPAETPAPPATSPAPAPTTSAPTAAPAATPVTTVESVELGNELTADRTIKEPLGSFTPHSIIFAVVNTSGGGNGTSTISVKWLFQDGQVVSEGKQEVNAGGSAHTDFHISKPSGFPVGNYTLEVSVDGKVARTMPFVVK